MGGLLGEHGKPVVDPEIRGRGGGAIGGIVAVNPVATRGALAVGLIEPVRGDSLTT